MALLQKRQAFSRSESCVLCKINVMDTLFGPVYKTKFGKNKKVIGVHYYCLLMSSKISQKGKDNQGIFGFFPSDIMKEVKRGSSVKCAYCDKIGATVNCVIKKCNKVFHLPCGISKGSVHQFFDAFRTFCSLHRPEQNIPKEIFKECKPTCLICSSEINKRNNYDFVWPICCKSTHLIHRRCVQTMAWNAGYYFKCPLCNNDTSFKKEMQRIGIYVPDMDAAWELEPNAYQELLVRGSGCESKECKCPNGRLFTKDNSPWQLELCEICGGNGVHLGCTDQWNKTLEFRLNWFCAVCKPVFIDNKSSTTPERDNVKNEENSRNCEGRIEAYSENSSSSSSNETNENIPIKKDDDLDDNAPDKEESVTKDDSDDEIICLSEEEAPSYDSKSDMAPQKCDSDDDCLIIDTVSTKRSIEDNIAMRKRFRTAPWISPVDKTNANKDVKQIEQDQKVPLPCGSKQLHMALTQKSSPSMTSNFSNISSNVSLPPHISLRFNEVCINKVKVKDPSLASNPPLVELSDDEECPQPAHSRNLVSEKIPEINEKSSVLTPSQSNKSESKRNSGNANVDLWLNSKIFNNHSISVRELSKNDQVSIKKLNHFCVAEIDLLSDDEHESDKPLVQPSKPNSSLKDNLIINSDKFTYDKIYERLSYKTVFHTNEKLSPVTITDSVKRKTETPEKLDQNNRMEFSFSETTSFQRNQNNDLISRDNSLEKNSETPCSILENKNSIYQEISSGSNGTSQKVLDRRRSILKKVLETSRPASKTIPDVIILSDDDDGTEILRTETSENMLCNALTDISSDKKNMCVSVSQQSEPILISNVHSLTVTEFEEGYMD